MGCPISSLSVFPLQGKKKIKVFSNAKRILTDITTFSKIIPDRTMLDKFSSIFCTFYTKKNFVTIIFCKQKYVITLEISSYKIEN